MRTAVRATAVLIAALALSGCTTAAGTDPGAPATAIAPVNSDVGNDRPLVTYDGLMVRRRVVVAMHAARTADLASLRSKLDLAAKRRHMTLSTLSASTLDPGVLERLAPDLVVALPSGATRADAGRLVESAFAGGGRIVPSVPHIEVLRVLVHDLRFTVATAHPAALAEAIAREGILTDELGNYAATPGAQKLSIAYTGPLLSDHSVQAVRIGIARPAHIAPRGVTVSARSTTGSGVDMSKEPLPAPAVLPSATSGHQHGAALATVGASPLANGWPFAALGLVAGAGLGLALVLLLRKRIYRPDRG